MQLGGYEVQGELGRGGMGVVLRGRAPDGRIVAIKVLLKPGSDGSAARFDRERRLLEGLGESEGFVPLIDSGVSPQGPYIVMPFLAGGTLGDRLKRGALEVDEAAALGEQLAAALGRAHAQGIVHRDLKPDNILFTEPGGNGRALVADLGLAKHFASGVGLQSVSLSKTGDTMGTAGYMSPEQMNDSRAAAAPSDVFSLGAILYECLTGQEAFGGESTQTRYARVASGNYEKLRSVRSDVPRWLARVVERALAPKPEQRYADGEALAQALRSRGAGEGSRVALVLGVVVVAGVAGVGLGLLPRLSSQPAVAPSPSVTPVAASTPSPSPAPTKAPRPLPAFTRDFQKTRRTRLASVLGDLAWKLPGNAGALAFLPDGQRFVASCDDSLDTFDLANGNTISSFSARIGPIMSIDPSPDGARLLVTGHQQISVLVDLASGAEVARYKGQYRQIYTGHFFPDGRRVVTSSDDDGTVRVWDADSGRQIWSKRSHICSWTCAVSPDGNYILTGGMGDGTTIKHDKGWTPDRVPEAQAKEPERQDWALRLWNAADGTLVRTFTGHRQFAHCVGFSRDGKRVVSGGWDCTVRVWDAETGALLRTLEGHKDPIRAVRFASGSRIVSSSVAGESQVRIWDVARPPGSELVETFAVHRGGVSDVAISPDGNRALTAGAERTVRLWDLDAHKELSKVSGHAGEVIGLGVVPGGKLAVSGGRDGTLRVWDLAESRETKVLDVQAEPGSCFALSPDGTHALVGHEDGSLKLWDLARGTSQALVGHKGRVGAVAFLPKGNRVVSAGADETVRVWDLGILAPVVSLPGNRFPVSLSVASDGNRVLVAGKSTGLSLWDLAGETELRRYPVPITAATIAPDGTRALVATPDGVLSIYGFEFGPKVLMEDQPVVAVAASSDFTLGASAGEDGVVQIWDLTTERVVDGINLALDKPRTLAFSPDGGRLLVGTVRGVTLVFELPGLQPRGSK